MTTFAFFGIDLSGPSNSKDTALCQIIDDQINVFENLNDQQILDIIDETDADEVLVALDAPLSYQEEGGYRDVDKTLRVFLNQNGFKKLGVMAPTMTKMVYLTLRGMRLRELLSVRGYQCFESHPGGALALDGFDYELIKEVKTNPLSISKLKESIKAKYSNFSSWPELKTDHALMSISAALAVYRYAMERSYLVFDSSVEGQPPLIL